MAARRRPRRRIRRGGDPGWDPSWEEGTALLAAGSDGADADRPAPLDEDPAEDEGVSRAEWLREQRPPHHG